MPFNHLFCEGIIKTTSGFSVLLGYVNKFNSNSLTQGDVEMKSLFVMCIFIVIFIAFILCGCSNVINDSSENIVEDKNYDNGEEVNDNNRKLQVLDYLDDENISESEIDWENTLEIMEIEGIEWGYAYAQNDKVFARINLMPDLDDDMIFNVSDEVYDLLRSKYPEANITIRSSM